MFPLGTYDRLVNEVKGRENRDMPVTFGILVADYDQQKAREYILNYLERFHAKSGEYINFYLPGYLDDNLSRDKTQSIIVGGKAYYFSRHAYMEFLAKLEMDFEIEYPYTPVLILIEYAHGHFRTSKKIAIELSGSGVNIEQTGKLFDQIFEIAKSEVDIQAFSRQLQKGELKKDLLGTIVSAIDNKLITALHDKAGQVGKYQIK